MGNVSATNPPRIPPRFSLPSISLPFPPWLPSSPTENQFSTGHSAVCGKVGEGSQSWLVPPPSSVRPLPHLLVSSPASCVPTADLFLYTAPDESSYRTLLTTLLPFLKYLQKTLHQQNWPVQYTFNLPLKNVHGLCYLQILRWAVLEVPLPVFTSANLAFWNAPPPGIFLGCSQQMQL